MRGGGAQCFQHAPLVGRLRSMAVPFDCDDDPWKWKFDTTFSVKNLRTAGASSAKTAKPKKKAKRVRTRKNPSRLVKNKLGEGKEQVEFGSDNDNEGGDNEGDDNEGDDHEGDNDDIIGVSDDDRSSGSGMQCFTASRLILMCCAVLTSWVSTTRITTTRLFG
jgi:hypothetical protein